MPYADVADRRKRVREYHRDPANRETVESAKRAWRERNPEKRAAQVAVGNALRDGKLIKGPCEREAGGGCDGRIEAHHDDHSRPLDVRWLCATHHGETRRKVA
jgi:hypothetical protein